MPALVALALVASTSAAVLTTITIDGDMSDWASVLADPEQTAYDGPLGPLPDRDAPVQSTGRDLASFAWTYDGVYLYFYVRRVGSVSNRQWFWFYVDTDEDGRMGTGEPVIAVSWWGNNRKTLVDQYSYVAAAPGGDPLGDASGFADGWDMPGAAVWVAELEDVRGGATNGIEMESRVAWSVLGVPPGSPMQFHISSSNSGNLPSQIDDNMGGPGGLVGSTRFAGVSIVPDRSGTIVPSGDFVGAHTVTNTGQSPDTVNLAWSWSGDFAPTAVVHVQDLDGDGLRDPGEPVLADTDGDGLPDTGPLVAGASMEVLAVITAPVGVVDGESVTVTTTASSSARPTVTDDAADTVTVAIPAITVVKSVDKASAIPGEVLTYTVTYASGGTTDAHNVVLVDAVPGDTVYVTGSAGGPGTTIEFSHDGGSTYDASEAAPVTHLRWTVLAPLAPGDSGAVTFQASVQ